MKVTLAEWMDLQKKQIRVCNAPEEKLPQIIFIGKPRENGMIEVYMKMVARSEWENFQKAWQRISGASHSDCDRTVPHVTPQCFLICN